MRKFRVSGCLADSRSWPELDRKGFYGFRFAEATSRAVRLLPEVSRGPEPRAQPFVGFSPVRVVEDNPGQAGGGFGSIGWGLVAAALGRRFTLSCLFAIQYLPVGSSGCSMTRAAGEPGVRFGSHASCEGSGSVPGPSLVQASYHLGHFPSYPCERKRPGSMSSKGDGPHRSIGNGGRLHRRLDFRSNRR